MSESNENDPSYGQAIRMAGIVHKVRELEPLTGDEQQELDSWLHSHASHAQLLEELLDRRQVTGELKAMAQYDADRAVLTIFTAIGEHAPPAVRPARRWMWPAAAAASLLLLAGAGWWFFLQRGDGATAAIRPGSTRAMLRLADGNERILDSSKVVSLGTQGAARVEQDHGRLVYTPAGNGPVAYNTVTTPPGGQYAVQLADGSEVWLNAASSITYPTSFSGSSREVMVTGEAFFRVAKDPAKPFLVNARKMQVQVLGTEFNVMAYEDEEAVRTTLVKGTVKALGDGQPALTLRPGEQAALMNKTGQLQRVKPVVDEVTAWRFGKFSFHDTDMAAIMRQVARWYDVKIEYRGSVANIGFNGNISRKEKVEDLLAIISDTRDVHFEIKDNKTIVVIPGPK